MWKAEDLARLDQIRVGNLWVACFERLECAIEARGNGGERVTSDYFVCRWDGVVCDRGGSANEEKGENVEGADEAGHGWHFC